MKITLAFDDALQTVKYSLGNNPRLAFGWQEKDTSKLLRTVLKVPSKKKICLRIEVKPFKNARAVTLKRGVSICNLTYEIRGHLLCTKKVNKLLGFEKSREGRFKIYIKVLPF